MFRPSISLLMILATLQGDIISGWLSDILMILFHDPTGILGAPSQAKLLPQVG